VEVDLDSVDHCSMGLLVLFLEAMLLMRTACSNGPMNEGGKERYISVSWRKELESILFHLGRFRFSKQ
jgi:hypothetical protein